MMVRAFTTFVLVLLAAAHLVAGPANAQANTPPAEAAPTPATLVADRIELTEDGLLIAEGNVEAFQDGTRMSASRVVYNGETDKIEIEGPIRVDDGNRTIIVADAGELDTSLHNGILYGAQLVLDRQLQIRSKQLDRFAGRYNQLYRVSATSCNVCENRAPLWQIRAQKLVHDEVERQLYFENARLLVWDVPIAYVPRLRIPEPGVERADGFLIPEIRTTSELGTGLRVPYFKTLGDHADVTLAPYISPNTNTLDFRYRQAFVRGNIELNGAVTRDEIRPDDVRGYLFATGRFALNNDFFLNFSLNGTSDNAYLKNYGITDTDRLASRINLTRTKRDTFVGFSLISYESLRDDPATDTNPGLIGDGLFQHRFFPGAIGGELRFTADLHTTTRDSDMDQIGRDVLRGTAEMLYLREHVSQWGLLSKFEAGIALDNFKIEDDDDFSDIVFRTTPVTAVTFRLPMTRQAAKASHYLEPVLQFAWSEVIGEEVPNEESLFAEFDEGNLLALSRFPAEDRREEGFRMAYGLNWTRYSNRGWQFRSTIGQVHRTRENTDFTVSSGLNGLTSDLLLAAQITNGSSLIFTGRTLLENDFSFNSAEFRGTWNSYRLNLSGSYVWQVEDPVEFRDDPVSEIWLDGSYRFNDTWRARADVRYDFERADPTYAGVALDYTNECVAINLTLNRRFTESSSVEPSTEFGFTIALRGFTARAGTESYTRSCS